MINNYTEELEVWKPVKYMYRFNSALEIINRFYFNSDSFFVSNRGRFKRDGIIANNKPDKNGYITIFMEGHRFKLHQIVLQVFKPCGIKSGLSGDHIDRNTANNNESNLRWADIKTQTNNRENKEYKYKKVVCQETGKIYNSCQEAEELLNLYRGAVSSVARGERAHANNFTFSYI